MSKKKRRRSNNSFKNYKVASVSQCPRCLNYALQRRERETMKPSDWNKAYVYLAWDYCLSCGYLQHYDDMRITMNEAIEIFKEEAQKEWKSVNVEQKQNQQHHSKSNTMNVQNVGGKHITRKKTRKQSGDVCGTTYPKDPNTVFYSGEKPPWE